MVTEAGRACGLRTLAIGYRLAPEHPFPAAIEDAIAAWNYLRAQGIAAGKIVVGGDSAGGGLTLALLQHLRDAHEDAPACGWLASPWTDLTMSGDAMASKDAVDPLIHKAYLEELAQAYVPAGANRKDPRISPLFANLSGLPPLLIQVGSDDFAGGFDTTGRGGWRGGKCGHARNLAANDPRVALVERAT